jgi:Fur family transcriptional regulator, peroxide stress response regulator
VVNTQGRLDELIAVLRERGYRLTPQRVAVLKVLAESGEHLCVDEIYERVKADFPMTSLATIYKTVALLKEVGEVFELGFAGVGSRYESRRPYPHPHVICLNCRQIVDVEIKALTGMAQEVADTTGYRVSGYQLDIFGICLQCQGKA